MARRRAPASMAFSTSSLTIEAGRSMTSPAAIWFARSAGSRLILPTSDPVPAPKRHQHRDHHHEHQPAYPPELRGLAARKLRQRDVHAPDAGDERRRTDEGGHDRQHFHHLVEAIADVRQ